MRKFWGSVSVLLLAVSAWAQTATSVPEGTPLKVKLQTTISTFSSRVGDPFQGKTVDPVVIDGKTVITPVDEASREIVWILDGWGRTEEARQIEQVRAQEFDEQLPLFFG